MIQIQEKLPTDILINPLHVLRSMRIAETLIYLHCMSQISKLNNSKLINQYISLLNALLKDTRYKVKNTLKRRKRNVK